MKELKLNPIIQTHYPVSIRRPTKRWIVAQRRPERQQVLQNENVETAYHHVLSIIKSLLHPGEVYYERDLKHDHTQGSLGMHTFVCSTLYWSLYCQLTHNYFVEFAFHNCPFEDKVREVLKAYPLDRTATECQLKPDYTTFYRTVLAVQDPQYLFTL